MQIEDMGFCPKGEAGAFVEGDTLHHDAGRLPFNTHGGLLSHAYVLGIAHVVECVKQLRGTAPAQVPGCDGRRVRRIHRPHGEHARADARTADGHPARRLPAPRRRRRADRAVLRRRGARRAGDPALRRVRARTSGIPSNAARHATARSTGRRSPAAARCSPGRSSAARSSRVRRTGSVRHRAGRPRRRSRSCACRRTSSTPTPTTLAADRRRRGRLPRAAFPTVPDRSVIVPMFRPARA